VGEVEKWTGEVEVRGEGGDGDRVKFARQHSRAVVVALILYQMSENERMAFRTITICGARTFLPARFFGDTAGKMPAAPRASVTGI
jgi:hypothetical protein